MVYWDPCAHWPLLSSPDLGDAVSLPSPRITHSLSSSLFFCKKISFLLVPILVTGVENLFLFQSPLSGRTLSSAGLKALYKQQGGVKSSDPHKRGDTLPGQDGWASYLHDEEKQDDDEDTDFGVDPDGRFP